MIQEDVIEPLKDPDSFKDYGIEPPNLFYFMVLLDVVKHFLLNVYQRK